VGYLKYFEKSTKNERNDTMKTTIRTSADFIGDEFESAYACAFGGTVNGGFNDHGKDVMIPGFGGVQVKASVTGAKEFLKVSLQRKQFIPLCVGEPGAKAEMLQSLKEFGAWFGMEIPQRAQLLSGVAQVRAMLQGERSYARA
jgi:hypothetical protein